MYFIETPVFARRRQSIIPDDEDFRAIQSALLKRPTLGDLMRGTGGLRKLRCALDGRGKRGGLRLIYYWHEVREAFLLLFMYPKNELDDLTATQRRFLARVVREEFT